MLFAPDTSPEARRVLIARLRAMTPAERLTATADLVTAGLELARRADGAPDRVREVGSPSRARFLRRWLGRDLAEAVSAEEARRIRVRE